MKKNKMVVLLLMLGLIFVLNGNVQAGPITTDGQWYEFLFLDASSGGVCLNGNGCTPSSGGNSVPADDPPWTFNATNPVNLTVTDAFLYGDAFNVYDFGVLIGSTPAVAIGGDSGLSDPNLALLDPKLSHASFLLSSGSHSITLVAYQTFSQGCGYFRASSVPEPSTLLLLSSALAGVGLLRRRFRS
jgi:hypothetical protein